MTLPDDGGPAFPFSEPYIPNTSPPKSYGGMSLRDYFAIHASEQDVVDQGEFLRHRVMKESGHGILPDDWRVTARYMHADAMLVAGGHLEPDDPTPPTKATWKLPKGEELWNADPECDHEITNAPGGGIRCVKCRGWFCY